MWFGEEDTRRFIAGEPFGQQTISRRNGPRSNALGDIGRRGGYSRAKGRGIQRRNRKDADAALMASRAAGKVRAGPLGCGGERGVDDGKEFVHALRRVYRLP